MELFSIDNNSIITLHKSVYTYSSPAAVLGLGDVFGHWVAFVKTNRHRIPDGHVCGEKYDS